MRPPSLPASAGSTVTRIALTAGGGGAGSLAALALVHKPGTTAVAAAAVSVALAANAADSATKALPAIIEAVGNLLTARIRAKADAKATIILAKTRDELARAGLDSGKTAQAAEMQRCLTSNPDLPKDRRPTDETLIKLHGAPRTRTSTSEPGTGPDTPGNGPRSPKETIRTVVPFRSDT